MKIYKLKPFKWKRTCFMPDEYIVHEAAGSWGNFRVERNKWEDGEPWTDWKASYCFVDYYDQDDRSFKTLKEAKQWCWEEWCSRILPALVEVPNAETAGCEPNEHSAGCLVETKCHDCGKSIGNDNGPPDGWELEEGCTVCHECCVTDTKQIIKRGRS